MMKQGKHFFYFCCFPWYPLWCFVIDQGSYGVLKSMKKNGHFPVWKKLFVGLLVWKKEIIF